MLCADLHAPCHHEVLVKQMLKDKESCRDAYIVGDLFDFYSQSRWVKSKHVTFEEEFRVGYGLLKGFVQRFEHVYLWTSNHDSRFKRHLYENVPTDLLAFINTDIVEDLILSTLPNVTVVRHRVAESRDISYLAQIDNVVFCHVEVSGADITKPVQEIMKRLPKWHDLYNLKPYDVVIQAHNHQSGFAKWGKYFLYQIPCLIDINAYAFDYVFDAKMAGNPPALGYMTATRTNKGFDPKSFYIHNL